MVELRWSARADQELEDILFWIGAENREAALRLLRRVERIADLLAAHPRMGVRRDDVRTSLRQLVIGPYLILYRTSPDSDEGPVDRVDVVSVVDGRRDLRDLF